MGIFDDLEQLNKPAPPPKATVGSPTAPKTVAAAENGVSPTSSAVQTDKSPAPNDLELKSPTPASKPSENKQTRLPERPNGRTVVRPDDRSLERTPRRSARRTILRHSFEIYMDQIDLLRRLSLEAKLGGDELSMSEMVREALDAYLARQRPEPNARTGERSSGRIDNQPNG